MFYLGSCNFFLFEPLVCRWGFAGFKIHRACWWCILATVTCKYVGYGARKKNGWLYFSMKCWGYTFPVPWISACHSRWLGSKWVRMTAVSSILWTPTTLLSISSLQVRAAICSLLSVSTFDVDLWSLDVITVWRDFYLQNGGSFPVIFLLRHIFFSRLDEMDMYPILCTKLFFLSIKIG